VPSILVALVAAIALNAGAWLRNYALFHNPIGSSAYTAAYYTPASHSPTSFLSTLVRNTTLQIAFPFSMEPTLLMTKVVFKFHKTFAIDASDPRTTFPNTVYAPNPFSLHEDLTEDTLHLALLLLVVCPLCFAGRRQLPDVVPRYLIALFGTFVLFSLLLRWQPWESRLQLPFYVLAAPSAAVVLSRLVRPRLQFLIGIALLVCAIPWVLLNQSRPLIGAGSVLVTSRLDLQFASRPDLESPSVGAAHVIQLTRCRQVGFSANHADTWEYPFWVLLAPEVRAGLHITDVVKQNASATLLRSGPWSNDRPCAIIAVHEDGPRLYVAGVGQFAQIWHSGIISVLAPAS
jgi:hypothetical protein